MNISNRLEILCLARLLGGLGTSLLFSAFESWLIGAHIKSGFGPSCLNEIFEQSVFINSLVAIFSGLMANALVNCFGFIGPFLASPIFNQLAFVYIYISWNENHGSNRKPKDASNHILQLLRDNAIVLVGLMQVCFESTMLFFIYLN